jgi:selenocysteine lyase/cysteine desulfurase
MALKGLIGPGSRVVTGPYEHNSVMRPLRRLQAAGADFTMVRPTADFGLDLDHLGELCRRGIDLAVSSHASNVTGAIFPIKQVSELIHAYGGVMVLDAAQTAGAVPIDMQLLGVDLLATSGHKSLLGPMGTGVLVLGSDLPVMPFRDGGTGFKSEGDAMPDELPWRLEAGTPAVPGIAGLLAGVHFIESVGVEKIGCLESSLARLLAEELERIDGVRVWSNPWQPLTGVVSFTIDGHQSLETGKLLDQNYGIGIRAGYHCSPTAHRTLGTFPDGTMRASFGYNNDRTDVERLLVAVREVAAVR